MILFPFLKIVAPQYIALRFGSQVHRAAEALLEILAFPAHTRAHPRPVAHDLETVVPDIQQVIPIDVALHVSAVDVGTSGDAAVNQHAADVDARTAEKVGVADLFLVLSRVGFTAESQMDTTLATGICHETHHRFHLRAGELQLVVVRRPPDRGNGEQPPVADSVCNQKFLQPRQFRKIALVYTGHHVIREPRRPRDEPQRPQSPLEAFRMVAQPVVGRLQSVQAHRNRRQSRSNQFGVQRLATCNGNDDGATRSALRKTNRTGTAVSAVFSDVTCS